LPTPLPNYTFTVTPPGGSPINYTAKFTYSGGSGGASISQNFGRQGDTATFILTDEYATSGSAIHIQVLSQVKLVDNTAGQTLFAGLCTNPKLTVVSPTVNEWTLQCVDYAFYADTSEVHGTFFGFTVDQIIISLTRQADCGITADTIENGGFVQKGPQLASFILAYNTLSNAWRKLSVLAGKQTPFGWYVDENRALHFFDATTAQVSGVTFTTSPTTDGSLTEGHFSRDSMNYEWDGTGIRNRIIVQGATNVVYHGSTSTASPHPTDKWVSNGVQTAWPLRYTVIDVPIIKLNKTKVTPAVVPAGSPASSSTWQVVENSVGGWSLTTSSPPAKGVEISIWYNYKVPVVAIANDFQSQATYPGPNHGIFATYILDRSLTTVPMALNRAMRERTEYAFAVERIIFNTTEDWIGWVRSGQVCTVVNAFVPDAQNSYALGINDTFLVTGNRVSFTTTGHRISNITAIRV